MMNELIKEIGLESGMLNYVDNESPRHYSLSFNVQDLEKFAELIVQECADFAYSQSIYCKGVPWNQVIKKHFDMTITNDDLAPYFRTVV